MITVKIPAAIQESTPVACIAGIYAGRTGVVSDDYKHGDPRAIVALRATVDAHEEIEPIDASCLALDISRPTGAAHLAWWLASPRLTQAQHDATLEALGIGGYNFLQILGLARVGDVAKIDARGLEILRDYAHRVAGVTNG